MRALLTVAIALALAQEPPVIKSPDKLRDCFRQAMNAAVTVKSEYTQSELMGEIAEAQARAGWADDAIETLEDMTYDYHQSFAYAAVGRELGRIGKLREARAVLEKGLSSTDDGEQDFKTGNAYAHFAVSFARIGDIERALKEAPEGGWGRPDSFALKEIAKLLARTGRIDRALKVVSSMEKDDIRWVLYQAVEDALKEGSPKAVPEIAARIEDESLRSSAWELYAEFLAGEGRFDEADRVCDAITEAFQRIRATAGCGVARVKANKGAADPARVKTVESLLAKVDRPGYHVTVRLAVAKWRAALGDAPAARVHIEKARDSVPKFEEEWQRKSELVEIAGTYAAIGFDEPAAEVASSLPDRPELYRSSAMKAIAVAQAERGKMDAFQASLKKCSHPTHRAEACLEAARHRIRAGARDEARRWLRTSFEEIKTTDVGFNELNDYRIGTPEFSLLQDLIDALAEAGDFETAVAAALKGEKDHDGGSVGGFVVRKMARLQVAAGHFDAAMAWVSKLNDVESRCLAYVGAAEGLIGSPPR